MLLEQEHVNPDQPDAGSGWTPLLRAATNGHEGVVKMLLERGKVNLDRADTKNRRTPLVWVVVNGHGGVAKILLERDGVRATTPDHNNQTPLSLALSKRHHEVVRTLQENYNSHATEPGG